MRMYVRRPDSRVQLYTLNILQMKILMSLLNTMDTDSISNQYNNADTIPP